MTETTREHVADDYVGYDPAAVERKWQASWKERSANSPDLAHGVRPFYQLMMFPYPSAEGLHIGNLFAFTGNDIHGRFQRLRGHTVFEPIGYDAFGIHSENYALKVGEHPLALIPRNIANFRRQLVRTGLMVDWHHELSTTDVSYYRWTQWVFLQLLRHGLAYRKKAAVNWCPVDKTVLANEQVTDGHCERCGALVEQRSLEQWFFEITKFAPRLLENLDHLDWSETTKTAQRNWIGRSEGAELRFPIAGSAGTLPASDPSAVIAVFTTRPDTVFGATYVVLAPEHPLVEALVTASQRSSIEGYQEQTRKQDVVTRKVDKEKTGVFTGSYAINPATGKPVPIWIADYVLMEYGTGAIMGVPAHDERDFEFATRFKLPILRVIAGEDDGPAAPLDRAYTGAGRLVNSGQFDALRIADAQKAMTAWLASAGAAKPTVSYRLHDWAISRQRYWGPPIPVVYCDSCGMVAVPEKDLPVLLPDIPDFRPDDSGISPLARHEEWYHTPCPECGKTARRETDVSDTFLDSSWYFLRFPSSDREDVPFDAALTRRWLPVTTYIGGNEHAVLHLLYSRFITMALHDAGHIDFDEPFTRFRAHGLIIREGAKMSKSKGNVVNPDQYIDQWGADTLRTYLMFLGPFEEGGDFRDASISGVRRFLDRVWGSVADATGVIDGRVSAAEVDPMVLRKLHQTIRKIGDDIPRLSYNTAIAAMMEYVNVLRAHERVPHRAEVEPLVQLMAPFAPHIAEELWERLGHKQSIFDSGWPTFNEATATEDGLTMPVQVNGKLRGTIQVARSVDQADALAAALRDPAIMKWVTGTPKKVIFVAGRLLNIVV
ncbi:MAG: leucine--tRNA ligase [Gemmatimonadaceae bacterium]